MRDHDVEDERIYAVVVNHEDQYSVWPAERPLPQGWSDVGQHGLKPACLAYVDEVWTDMRPLSLRDIDRHGARSRDREPFRMSAPRHRGSAISGACDQATLDYSKQLCLHDVFEAQARTRPNAVAVRSDGERITYGELNTRANRIAHRLLDLGVKVEHRIAVLCGPSTDQVAALIGILKAGATVVALDPAAPPAGIRHILAATDPQAVVTTDALAHHLPHLDAHVLLLPFDADTTRALPAHDPRCPVSADDLCAIFYTSGSTGQPKGVMTPHRSCVSRLFTAHQAWQLIPTDKCLLQSGMSYAASLTQLFLPFVGGAELVLGRSGGERDAYYLARLIAEANVTVAGFAPAMLAALLKELQGLNTVLRIVYCSADTLPPAVRDACLQALPTELYTFYGTTEAPGIAQSHCHPGERHDRRTLGRPTDMAVHILDADMQPLPVGAVGELYTGGISLTRGYLNQPGRTAERFLPDPFSSGPGARLYRTGDLCRFLSDSTIEFVGRADNQVNVGGHRIEPEEIEFVLSRHPSVKEAAVTVEHTRGAPRLAAYVTFSPDHAVPFAELCRYLRHLLPAHMIPPLFRSVSSLPRLDSGKIDRAMLGTQNLPAASPRRAEVALRSATEARVAAIWCEILVLDCVTPDDNFFDVGGDSLAAIKFLTWIRAEFGHELPFQSLFQAPTLMAVAEAIDGLVGAEGHATPDRRPLAAPQHPTAPQHPSPPQRACADPQALTVAAMSAKSALGPDVRIDASLPGPRRVAPVRFLTGATGYLGAFLLRELLDSADGRVACLVRAADRGQALQRIERGFRRYSITTDGLQDRVTPVTGDLAQERFGLSPAAFDALAKSVDVIYHNAALVNYFYPYTTHEPSNVNGTREVVRLAGCHKTKPVHFVSSMSVFHADRAGDRSVFYEHDNLDDTGVPYSGYDQSKWVAEKMLCEAVSRGLPVSIYRPSLLLGHSGNGSWNVGDVVSWLVRACVRARAAPDVDVMISAVPVDYASRAIVSLSLAQESPRGVFHIVNGHPASARQLTEWLNEAGYPMELLPYDQWCQAMVAVGSKYEPSGSMGHLYLVTHAQHFIRATYDCQNAERVLHGSGDACPPLDFDLVRSYLSSFAASGFIPAPISRQNSTQGS